MEEQTNGSIFDDFIDKKVKIVKGDFNKNQLYQLTGLCRSIDGYLNTVLEDCILLDLAESQNTEKTNCEETQERFKTCFVTGNSLKHICLANDENK